MDEITLEDMLLHYESKLKEAADEIQRIQSQMKKMALLLDDGWRGEAAEACRDKLQSVIEELTRADGDLSDAMVKLSAMGALLTGSGRE